MCLAATLTMGAQDEDEYQMEMGGALGLDFYMGDANKTPFKHSSAMGGFIVRKLFNPRMALKGDLTIGHLTGNTKGYFIPQDAGSKTAEGGIPVSFKFKRNELIGYPTNIKNLFNGYKDVNESVNEDAPLYLAEPEPIKDVPDFPIEKLKEADWNIAHIGRMMKAFVAHVIIGVAEFARRHPDKKINFILVGQIIPDRANLMKEKFAGLDNLTIIPLGDMIPIPRSLFSKIDVVCAMAGAASYSAREGVPVIVGNSNKIDKTSGVLGVDTKEIIYSDEKLFDYPEALENVLVKKLYEGKKFELPYIEPSEKSYSNIWKVLENAAPDKEYFAEKLSRERIRNQAMIFPFGYIARGARIILVGATEFAKDYKRQIESQSNASLEFGKKYIKQMTGEPYAEIVATLDEHPEEFDNSVLGLERLQKRDYDVILLSTYPENTQSVFNKITQLVPDMANRIVYNHQTVQI